MKQLIDIINPIKREITQRITFLDKLDQCKLMTSSKYDDVCNFNFSIKKQHNTINMQIRVYNRYKKQYITNGKNWRKWKFSPKKKDDVFTQNGGLFEKNF